MQNISLNLVFFLFVFIKLLIKKRKHRRKFLVLNKKKMLKFLLFSLGDI